MVFYGIFNINIYDFEGVHTTKHNLTFLEGYLSFLKFFYEKNKMSNFFTIIENYQPTITQNKK